MNSVGVPLDKPLVRVVVAGQRGSAPRESGTVMLVNAEGQSGTIGGGALEYKALEVARAMLGKPFARELLDMPLGPALGQCCGGSVKVLVESFANGLPELEGIYARPVASGAVPEIPPLRVQKTLREMRSGVAARGIVLVDGWLVEPLAQDKTPLWIYGAGHVGRALVSVLSELPFTITWVDTDRARFPETLPEQVDMLVAGDPARVVKHAPEEAVHLVLTYSHALDFEICHAVLSRGFGALGVIGSDTKRARFMKRLRQAGVDPSRMQCPIGDRSLGKEPMAIAVGVAAALLQQRATQEQKREVRA